jgi:hypothetical protein
MERKFLVWNRLRDARMENPVVAQSSLPEPVAIVQNAMSNPSKGGLASLSDAFGDIVRGEMWRHAVTAEGDRFQSFGAFAIAASPCGLGIRSRAAASLARHVLLEAQHFAEWTEILERIARKPGRPKTNANDEDFRFYVVSKAPHAKDRLLLILKNRHPDHFNSVCVGECTPYRAAVNAGEVLVGDMSQENKRRLHFGVCDFQAAGHLQPKAQKKFLCAIFRKMHVDAQCSLIANELEPRLGAGLAKEWRSRFDDKASGS